MQKRDKRPVTYSLDADLLDEFEKWVEKQSPKPSKTAVVETALREFLKRRGSK